MQSARRSSKWFRCLASEPESVRAKEDKRLLLPIRESWLVSGSGYGYPKISDGLREMGEQCGINRVHRLVRSAGIRSQSG
jgi:putative transposase